jgi:hypothetical protein
MVTISNLRFLFLAAVDLEPCICYAAYEVTLLCDTEYKYVLPEHPCNNREHVLVYSYR